MVSFPNAKINLGLYVTGKRPDGYHDLETVFLPVPHHCDVLEMLPAQESSLSVSGIVVGGEPSDNLVWKAWQLLQRDFRDRVPALTMMLHKVIPTGAGLGGGSSDGAFALKMIDELAALGLTREQLEEYALMLGSDCPFFIRNSPQFAGGRGEEMVPVDLDLSGFRIRVESPGIHVSTAAAFSGIAPRPAPFDLRRLAEVPVSGWRQVLGNDFEKPVFAAHPSIALLKDRLYAEGAVYAQMSGSGSAVFGIFAE